MQSALIGTWRLVAMESRAADGQISRPFGENPTGLLIYSADGFMAVSVMGAGREHFTSGDLRGGTPEEKAGAVGSYLSYSGSYDVLPDRVVHHVEVSLLPNWCGTRQERFFELHDDRLVLRTPQMVMAGLECTTVLTWRRARPA
ncbi:MAG: lipocalin-like domain-containing protein [Bryobacteraceae bacterium]|nr:lipocalin-like domain-containing protein [Bryobacteraceae bacterium]